MNMNRSVSSVALATALMVAPVLGTVSARAATIDWAVWSNSYTTGYPSGGSASATMGTNTVTYSGELLSVVANYPSWGPAGTFNGGTVDNAPPQSGGIVQLRGGAASPPTDTIAFLTPVVNPVLAIWSLGQNGIQASFDFNQPFTIQSGGPSNEYGGIPITQLVLSALGSEGNGTIQFIGTYSSISWTNPVDEFWYGFTVGAPTPIPAALPLFASGLGGLGLLSWRRKRKAARAAAAVAA